jgi:hypothetical protein
VTIAKLALSPPETRENFRTARERSKRFSLIEVKDGPWLVLDLARDRKIVASCFDAHAAETFAALMNGDVQRAIARRDAAIAFLTVGQSPIELR